jgi:hypothetical protein
VPISMLILMFVFNSGSIHAPQTDLHFWLDVMAVIGVIGIISYWNWLKRLRWNVGFTIYLYIFLIFILRNPFKILTDATRGQHLTNDWALISNSVWVAAGIFAIGILLEVLILQLRQFKTWAWWIALSISILYVVSTIFFFSGTLGIWSLLDAETKQKFKRYLRHRHS